MDVASYFNEIKRLYALGQTTEHSFRPALSNLFNAISPEVSAINEPKSVQVGRPDFVFLREVGKGALLTIGHCEAKDIGVDLNPKAMSDSNKEQFARYARALPNLIYTNGVDFRFYRKAELVREISIADFIVGLHPRPDQFEPLAAQLRNFLAERLQTITSAETLAEFMAGKTVLIRDILAQTLKADHDLVSELGGQFIAFKEQLIHTLEPDEFSDIYAETIAYGLFAGRLHDETPETFSRQEALALLPHSNPFLRNLFGYIAGPHLDLAIARTVEELAEIFQAVDLQALFADFGQFTQRSDPFIHFYETFLAAYNPAKRKARGVWYTPESVVNFIVRAVDDVLKTEFGLSDGLADTSKVTVDWDTGQTVNAKPNMIKKTLHRVQILDPAVGTGTFLAEVIRQIAPKIQGIAPGQWSAYVEKELIPRLHGFELLMASYAMCHMKLDMMLTSLGYKPTAATSPRLKVYLTNSLEEGDRVNQSLPFAQWLSNEAREANTVKRDVPVMVVLGNPPYSGESSNKGEWITRLMEAYKREPGGKAALKERNPKWINDDYVKFIRFAEQMVSKTGEGVVGFITNHGYLDNPTFRGMRWHLMNTFDKIWVLDLHGNAKKKEVSPDGSPDKNVFDIMQGVAILIAVKRRTAAKGPKPLATVYHGELWGSRQEKYTQLFKGTTATLAHETLPHRAPQYPFVQRDFSSESAYLQGFSLPDLMPVNSVGIVTARDDLTIDMDQDQLWRRVEDFTRLDAETLRHKYKLGKDVQDWSVDRAKADVKNNFSEANLVKIAYRPFDNRWTFYTGTSRGFQCRPRNEVMANFLSNPNIGMSLCRQSGVNTYAHVSCTDTIVDDSFVSNRSKERGYSFPLYIYPTAQDLDQSRRVNMDPAIRRRIEAAAAHPVHGRADELAIFDYIYGVLHCPAYRQTYAEFLKIDFPRVPYPATPEAFWDIAAKGNLLRRLHLMEPEAIGPTATPFTGEGDSRVTKVEFASNRVAINETQGFENVSTTAWEFYIGGYQPAQKWLKDRKGRSLTFEDIRHYQRIIKILEETHRIMQQIVMDFG